MPNYTSGVINIPNVTGNIVITATATAATVTSISAVFNQGQNVIYDIDSLDTLKQYLTVTATYTGGTTAVVTGYTLSGALTAGTSTVTVTYSGKTTTFNVSVTSFLSTLDFFKGTNFAYVNGNILASGYNMNRACTFLRTQFNGAKAYVAESVVVGWTDPAYAIPIPNGRTKVTVSCPVCCAISVHKVVNNSVVGVDNGYWSSTGGFTNYDLSSYITQGATHLCIGFKDVNNASLENVTIDNTTVSISFS